MSNKPQPHIVAFLIGVLGMKCCNKCKVIKPYTEFSKNKSTKDGYGYQCKICDKQYFQDNKYKRRQYYIDNKDIISVKRKQYYIDNKDILIIKCKQYYIDNKDIISVKNKHYIKQYRINNPNYDKKYQLDNAEAIKKYKREWRLNNIEAIKKHDKQRYQDNIEIIKEKRKKYRQTEHCKLLKRSSNHKRRVLLKDNTPLGKNWKPKDIIDKLKLQKYKCIYCQTSIKDYHEVDHIISISKGGNNEVSNIQLLCKQCNGPSGKSDKSAHEFAQKHGKLF